MEPEVQKTNRGCLIAAILGGIAVIILGTGSFFVGDIIDLPAWANVRGVDIPIVGDTDAIDCRLSQVDGTTNVEIRIVDGDESTYDQYVFVWNNGNVRDASEFERVANDRIIAPSTPGAAEQFYSISIEPVEEDRVFCESIILR